MPRIAPVKAREDLATAHQAVWDRIASSRGRVAGPFAMLLHSPEIAAHVADLGAYIRFSSRLDGRDRELAILAVARHFDCGYEWTAHAREARKAGVREEAIAAVRDRSSAGLEPDEATIVAYARQLLASHRADDQTFETLRTRLGVERLVELTATIGYYSMIACTLNAFEVVPGPDGDQLPA